MATATTTTLGLFAHYRPVVLALPPGGGLAVATFLGAKTAKELSAQLDEAGLLYRHHLWGAAVSRLLEVALDHATLTGLPAELFRWNPEACVEVEPLSLELKQNQEGECLEMDVRFRSEKALLPGTMATPAMLERLRQQGNLWWSTGKGDPIDGREPGSMDPEDEATWRMIVAESGLQSVAPADLLMALDDFADGAIDFCYSDLFLQSMATTLSMPKEYLEAWQAERDGVIVDVGDLKIQGYC